MAEDPSCIGKCKSTQHGDVVCAIAREGSSGQIVTRWPQTCGNYGHVKDSLGRTALHMVAATSNIDAAEWLIKHEGSKINAKEATSGYTPLHQSIFNGQLSMARLLVQNEASLTLTDNEALTPLELYLKDRNQFPRYYGTTSSILSEFKIQSDPTELCIWGNNSNYNLGIVSSERLVPELLEVFGNEKISQVVLQPFHSIFVSQNGEVFTCGSGTSGRLGLGNDSTALKPTKVNLTSNYRCTYAAAGANHSLFLMENGEVLACGLNTQFVLGFDPPVEQLLTPKALRLCNIQGVRTSDCHSVFFRNNQLYTCGRNFGQLGLNLKDAKLGTAVYSPKLVACNKFFTRERPAGGVEDPTRFVHVECTDVATVFSTNASVYILYNFEFRNIRIKQFESDNIVKIGAIGGQIRPKSSLLKEAVSIAESEMKESGKALAHLLYDNKNFCPLTVIMLTKGGSVIIWRESKIFVTQASSSLDHGYNAPRRAEGSYSKLFYSIGRSLIVRDVSVSKSCIMLTTSEGEAFSGEWNYAKEPILHRNLNQKEKGSTSADLEHWGVCTHKKGQDVSDPSPTSMSLECVKMKRIPKVYSALKVHCDPSGKTFAVIKRHQRADYITIPNITPSTMNEDLKLLYDEANLDDGLHDVVFEIKRSIGHKRQFPAHQFIIASRCTVLYEEIKNAKVNHEDSSSSETKVTVPISDVTDFVFEQVLQLIYFNKCALITLGSQIENYITNSTKTVIQEAVAYCRKLNLQEFAGKLNCLEIVDGVVCVKAGSVNNFKRVLPTKTFSPGGFSQLTDLTLVTSEGKEIRAHRCILYARAEHFHVLWNGTNSWSDSKANRLNLPIKFCGVKFLVDYLYADKLPQLDKYELTDKRRDIMEEKMTKLDQGIVALETSDYFFLNGFRSCAELVLYELINLKNVSSILEYASWFNAEQLREACFDFIILNLAPLLENRLLDSVSANNMGYITKFYQTHHPEMKFRVLPVDSELTPIDKDYIKANESILAEFSLFVNNREEYNETCTPNTPKPSTTNKKRKAIISNKSNECDEITSTVRKSDESFESPISPTPQPKILTDHKPLNFVNGVASSADKERQRGKAPIQVPIGKVAPQQSAGASLKMGNISPSGFIRISPGVMQAQSRDRTRQRTLSTDLSSSFEEFPSLGSVPDSPMTADFQSASYQKSTPVTLQNLKTPGSVASSKKRTKWKTFGQLSEPEASASKPVPIVHQPGNRNPQNPWNRGGAEIGETEGASASGYQEVGSAGGHAQLSFKEILKDEQEKEANWKKITTKSLHLMQVEDTAINQLMERYSSEDSREGIERIEVVPLSVTNIGGPPTWPHQSPSSPSSSTFFGLPKN